MSVAAFALSPIKDGLQQKEDGGDGRHVTGIARGTSKMKPVAFNSSKVSGSACGSLFVEAEGHLSPETCAADVAS